MFFFLDKHSLTLSIVNVKRRRNEFQHKTKGLLHI